MMQDGDRYALIPFRRPARSGLLLPAITLGLWQNFGGDRPIETQRAIIRRAFDLGITHFDLANNYGPPYGAAENNFGRIFDEDLRPYRDELIISTKAGYDQNTPLQETMGALDSAVRQGKALYVGVSSYSPERTEEAIEILNRLGTPLLVHQPSYSLLNRW